MNTTSCFRTTFTVGCAVALMLAAAACESNDHNAVNPNPGSSGVGGHAAPTSPSAEVGPRNAGPAGSQ